eukprot:scaffold2340_cov113-Isochrysis_galbana.AAC.10
MRPLSRRRRGWAVPAMQADSAGDSRVEACSVMAGAATRADRRPRAHVEQTEGASLTNSRIGSTAVSSARRPRRGRRQRRGAPRPEHPPGDEAGGDAQTVVGAVGERGRGERGAQSRVERVAGHQTRTVGPATDTEVEHHHRLEPPERADDQLGVEGGRRPAQPQQRPLLHAVVAERVQDAE